MGVAAIPSSANIVVLLALSVMWARDYLTSRSRHAVGLLVFGVSLFAENTLAFCMCISDPTLSRWFGTDAPVIVWWLIMPLYVFETARLVLLAWITLD